MDPVRVDQDDAADHEWPSLDVAPDGTAAVVWESERHVWARILPADF
jgi:hypothetical protein